MGPTFSFLNTAAKVADVFVKRFKYKKPLKKLKIKFQREVQIHQKSAKEDVVEQILGLSPIHTKFYHQPNKSTEKIGKLHICNANKLSFSISASAFLYPIK